MAFVVLLQQQVAASPLPLETTALPADVAATATRLHKRHSDWHEEYAREMSSQELEWVNPCGGMWVEPEVRPRRPPVKKFLHQLQMSIGHEQFNLNLTDIDISKMRLWSKHQEKYSFLPQLKLDSNVSLRRWHRQMQIYVGAFVYLRRAQMHWDHEKGQQESATSQELLLLKRSARSILCEIETTINNTAPASASSAATSAQRRAPQLRFVSQDAMEKRLNFTTNLGRFFVGHGHGHKHRHGHDVAENEVPFVYPVDLRFAKYSYKRFLRSIVKVIRQHLRRPGQVALDNRSASSSAAASSADIDSLMNSSQDRSLGLGSQSQERIRHRGGQRQRKKTSSNTSSQKNSSSQRNNSGQKTNISSIDNKTNVSGNSSSRRGGRRPKQPRRPKSAPPSVHGQSN